jgi:iron(III) transport system permease protein
MVSLRRAEEALSLCGVGALFALVVLPPLVLSAGELLAARDPAEVLAATLGAGRTWTLLLRSLGLAAAVTILALALGVPLALLLGKTDLPGRRAALLLHAFPMFLPPFLLGLGWFHLFGRQGVLGGEASAALLFSEVGVVAVLTLAFTPVVTCLGALGLRGVDASLEEAARAVAGPRRVALRILLPAAAPALALGALAVFTLALSELGVPMLLRVRTYPAAVFARLGGVDYAPGEAFALALPLLAVALLLLFAERRFLGRRRIAVLGVRGGERPILPLGRYRSAAAAAGWIAAVLSVAPVAALAARAGTQGLAAVPEWIGDGLWNSLMCAGIAATAMTTLGLFLGHAIARRRPGSGVLDGVAVLAFLTPAAVLGVGLIAAWNRPETDVVYGTVAIVVVGLVARYGVVASRTVAASVVQAPLHLEEAARATGAGYLRRLVGIVLPVHARAVAVAWLFSFVFALRDLDTAVLVYPPGGAPLTVRIFTLEANGPEPVVAALSVVHVLVTAVALLVGAALLPRRRVA